MSPSVLDLKEFLAPPGPIIDVRSPGEFAQGHIPGAINVPLFSDEERAEVGTAYKQESPEKALQLGLELFGPKLATFRATLQRLAGANPLRIHCWRGGMRSQSVAKFMAMTGTPAVTLKGGYKSYRSWALQVFEEPRELRILGGFTGCGKTSILHILAQKGQQMLDLEGHVKHRGSAYGALPDTPQPSTEQFENDLALEMASLDANLPLWLEDENRQIGTCTIPLGLIRQMQKAPLYIIERSFDERLDILEKVYEELSAEDLEAATRRIGKRLGLQRMQEVLDAGKSGEIRTAMRLVLAYYDRAYAHSVTKRKQPTLRLQANGLSDEEWAFKLAEQVLTCLSS